MAATISDAANGSGTTASSQLDTGATITASIGDGLIVLAAYSNDNTNGAAPTFTSSADSDGVNGYTERVDMVFDPGAAGAGAALGIYTAILTDDLSSAFVRITSSVCTERTSQVYRMAPGAGETISFIAADETGSASNTATHDAPTVSVTSGDTIFGVASIETDDAVTGDSDTTNGSWSAIITRLADAGADGAAMSCSSQYKTVTSTGNQSWACTTAVARDSARSYVIMRSEGAAAAGQPFQKRWGGVPGANRTPGVWRDLFPLPKRKPAFARLTPPPAYLIEPRSGLVMPLTPRLVVPLKRRVVRPNLILPERMAA